MAFKLKWDEVGERLYETGVDHGVLYPFDTTSNTYSTGVVWNGLTNVTESPSGAESNPIYADNIKYVDMRSAEDFGATIEAYTFPDEWYACDGSAEIADGVVVGQQDRVPFGFSYRTLVGNDVKKDAYGYKLHIIYNATASPSERGYATVNDSPEAIQMSWEITTTPIEVPGFKKAACLTFDSTKTDEAKLAELEAILYGSDETGGADPRLPLPDEIVELFSDSTSGGSSSSDDDTTGGSGN